MSTMTAAVRRRVAVAVAILLVATAALLVLGIVLERHAVSAGEQHEVSAIVGEQERGHHDESGEATHAEHGAPADGANAGESVTVTALESHWIIGVGTIAAIALAVAVWRRPTRPVIAVVVAFAGRSGGLRPARNRPPGQRGSHRSRGYRGCDRRASGGDHRRGRIPVLDLERRRSMIGECVKASRKAS